MSMVAFAIMAAPQRRDRVMVVHIGPLATPDGEPRQARKGATVTVDACAGVWLVWAISIFSPFSGGLSSDFAV